MSNKSPFISVLVPNYGYSPYIFDCLDTLVNQKESDEFAYEILFYDQNEIETFNKIKSEIENRYQNRVTVIHSDVKGLLRARHMLTREAKGQYCAFVDSDDFVDSDFLVTLYENLKKSNFPDILIHNYVRCDSKGVDHLGIYNPPKCKDEEIMDYYLFTNLFNEVVRKLFKKELYKVDDTVDMSSVICEDWIFSYPLMKEAKSIYYAYDVQKYHYRLNDASLLHTIKFERAMDNLSVHDKYLADYVLNDFQKKLFDSQNIMTFVALGDLLINDKNLTKEQFKMFVDNAINHLYDVDIDDSEGFELTKNHKTIYRLLKKKAYGRLKLIFKIRKLLK